MRGAPRTQSYSIHKVKCYTSANSLAANLILGAQSETVDTEDPWLNSKIRELRDLVRRGTLAPAAKVPAGATILGSRMVNTVKANGEHKSRFIAQGFRDPEAQDTTVNAPTLSRYMLRVIVSVVTVKGFPLKYRDYSQAYLQSTWDLSRDVYLRLKPEVRGLLSRITESPYRDHARIVQPLYGLRESGTYWHATLTTRLRDQGFKTAALDPCAFYLMEQGKCIGGVGVLVDETLIFGNDATFEAESRAAHGLENKGTCLLPFTFNGVQIQKRKGSLICDQNAYIDRALHPLIPSISGFDEFRSLRGKLSYLSTGTRPDIQHVIVKLSQVTEMSYTEVHAKKLRSTAKLVDANRVAIHYAPLDPDTPRIRVFADASYGSNEDFTSQLGFVVFLGDSSETIHYLHSTSHKAKQVAHSVMSAKLLALVLAYDFAEGIQNELRRCGLHAPLVLATDSKQIYDAVASSSILHVTNAVPFTLLLLLTSSVSEQDLTG
ncbi:Transposon Ty1-BL Gag-Pol polyprotein [Porphyridium purpureum]|uniref:Transposon Ty1-BL Gag-Pol polyprotein n=1 Tax=Porphyridium purpureum TaxID=35688 RepID=A0A5J4YRR8_PORPP|nr:Transposon Ty1-BL Gag-Pol polyprotein [Porphyridium purpureum]|eukprot:POR4219..scf236_6